MVGNYINAIKSTFGFNFDLYKLLNSMDTQKMETKRGCQLKSFSLITCKLVSRKKLFTIKIYIKSRLHYIDINAYQRITRVST